MMMKETVQDVLNEMREVTAVMSGDYWADRIEAAMGGFRALAEACEDMRCAAEECDIGEGMAYAVPFHMWGEFLTKLDAAQQEIDSAALTAQQAKGAISE